MEKIKVGIMSYGMSGKIFHAPFFDVHEGFDLVAITERSKNNAVEDYSHIVTYRDVDAMLADHRLDLVVVNTPNYTHFEYAKAALNAGKHVLVEKPFCVTRNEAKELFALAFRKDLLVLAFHNRRYSSDFLAVQKVVQSGRLGRIMEAHLRFDRYRNEIGQKAFKEEPIPGAGIFYDLGAHMIDQAITLFGTPSDFHKTYGKYRAQTQVDDVAHAHLEYPNGLNVYVTTNMLVVKQQPAYVFYGMDGTLVKNWTDVQETQLLAGMKPNHKDYGKESPGDEGKLYTFNAKGEVVEELVPLERGNFMGLFDQVYDAIKNKGEYFVKQNEIIAQLSILEK